MEKIVMIILFSALACKQPHSPTAEIKSRNLFSIAGGGCGGGMQYRIYAHKGLNYCFFNKRISVPERIIRKEMFAFADSVKYYPVDQCLVVRLVDSTTRRSLQGYITERLCD